MYWCCLQVFSPRQYDELLSKIASFNSLFAIIVGVFNARFSSWRNKDNTTHLEALTSLHNIDQLFQNPCTYYPFLVRVLIWFSLIHPTVVKFTHSTLNTACHHQITNCKLNLDIEDPPPY